jgi:lysophospholipase L1-like esterase
VTDYHRRLHNDDETGTGAKMFLTRDSRRRQLARLLLVTLSLAISVLAIEAVLQCVLDPLDYLRPKLIADDVLGFRIQPGSNGHDAWGCRNRSVPASARVVAIGDSLTYGQSAKIDQSWPAVLGRRLGVSVYNLSTPGYGPAQYCHLLESEGVTLGPRLVIVGFYYGNDLENAAAAVYSHDHWREVRDPSTVAETLADPPIVKNSDALGGWEGWKLMLQERSFFYRLVDFALKEINRKLTARLFPAMNDDFVRVADGITRLYTTLTPGKRIRALDLSDPRIREGLRVSLALFLRMHEACAARGINFVVLLLPTKESVLSEYLDRRGITAAHPKLAKAIDEERELDHRVKQFLEEHGVAYLDPRDALAAALGRELLYSTDLDGHPSPGGYAVIAESVADGITRRHLLDSPLGGS